MAVLFRDLANSTDGVVNGTTDLRLSHRYKMCYVSLWRWKKTSDLIQCKIFNYVLALTFRSSILFCQCPSLQGALSCNIRRYIGDTLAVRYQKILKEMYVLTKALVSNKETIVTEWSELEIQVRGVDWTPTNIARYNLCFSIRNDYSAFDGLGGFSLGCLDP